TDLSRLSNPRCWESDTPHIPVKQNRNKDVLTGPGGKSVSTLDQPIRLKMTSMLPRLTLLILVTFLGMAQPAQGQSGPLQQARTVLEQSHPLPPGWSVKLGKDEQTKGAGALTDAKTKTIYVNPAAIAKQLPSVTPAQAELPGVLYIFLLHEWYHAAESAGQGQSAGGGGSPPYNTDCGEI